MYTNDQLEQRQRHISERAAEMLDEWLQEQAIAETAPYDVLRAENPAGSLCGYFASVEAESELERETCWHAMEREIAAAGGLFYVPELDGSPCVTTAEQLRVMAGAGSWAAAMHAFHATPIVRIPPPVVGHVIFKGATARVRIHAIDGNDDAFGQFTCFEAMTEDGDAVAQVTIRDEGTFTDQCAAARAEFQRLGYNV